MEILPNTNLPAIVIVAFNRGNALKRLLESIETCKYKSINIPLIISIDGGGDGEVIKIAKSFNWKYGPKNIITHKENLGLKAHVLKCGDLSAKYGSIIMLEEDCFVSPNFYNYASHALDFYKNDSKIAGVSLYSYSFNENAHMLFFPLKDGKDIYFMQVPSSWGQAWTQDQWANFITYYKRGIQIEESDKLPQNVKTWSEKSWKKLFYKYLIQTDKYLVYPHVSLTTNFADAGEHYEDDTDIWQVQLDWSEKSTEFISFSDSKNIYDAYFEILPKLIGVNNDIIIDLFGTKQFNLFDEEYAYSIKDCNNPMFTISSRLKPNFMNIENKTRGKLIKFGKKSDFTIVSLQTRHALLRSMNEFIYDQAFESGKALGFNSGYFKGRSLIVNSIPYKIGNAIVGPLKVIRNMFSKSTK